MSKAIIGSPIIKKAIMDIKKGDVVSTIFVKVSGAKVDAKSIVTKLEIPNKVLIINAAFLSQGKRLSGFYPAHQHQISETIVFNMQVMKR